MIRRGFRPIFSLPLLDQSKRLPPPPLAHDARRPTLPPVASLRLLLVDDHALVRDGVRALLTGQVATIDEASTAAGALEAIEAHRPDVVLSDIGMKDVNGLQLLGTLLERWPDLTVVMLSMYDDAAYVQQALRTGARGYVLKDSPGSDILKALEAVCAGEVYLGLGVREQPQPTGGRRPLSERECEILRCLALAWPSKQIAAELGLSVRTVETHRQNIRRKLGLAGQAELIRYAVEHHRDTLAPR